MANSQTPAALAQPQPISAQLPTTQADWQQFATTLNQWLQFLAQKPTGWNPLFQTGYVAYAGASGLTGNINFEFGTNLPNPSGTNGAALLLGSGAGGGVANPFWVITDQAYDLSTPGNLLGITAGETQPGSTQPGGLLWLIGGGADQGNGGAAIFQGGTSANGNGGDVVIQGGSATNGGIPGDVFIIGGSGQAPGQGASVHLIMSQVNGISGVVRIRVNSNALFDFYNDGSIFIYNGGGFGTAGQQLTSQGPGLPVIWS